MPVFTYSARTRTGEKLEGRLDAPDRRAALRQIEQLGATPIRVTEGAASAAPAAADGPKRFHIEWRRAARPRMPMRETLLLTRELGDLLASGMTLGNALHTLARRHTGRAQDLIVQALRDDIVQGAALSEALARWPETFTPLFLSMIRAGEVSGTLGEVLQRLSAHYERVQAAREKVAMALVYPLIVLVVGGLTMIFAVVFVVPRFSAIFKELGSTLPLPTRILIGVSNFMIHWGWAVLLAAIAGGIGFRRWVRTPAGRERWHRAQLKIPVARKIVTANAYAQFARTLGALLANGVPVLQALSIVENTVGNAVLAGAIRSARDQVTDGATISGPLAAAGAFPPLLTDMLAVGEQAGDMSGALGHIARRYDDELDRAVKLFTTLLEPLLILVMAVLVGFVAISMLLAVFDLTSGLKT